MIRILHSVSNMDRAGIETMLMNYYRYPVYYAMYCALIIPLALYVWQNEKNAWNSCVLGLNVIAAFLTESRGTIVVLLALFLVYQGVHQSPG